MNPRSILVGKWERRRVVPINYLSRNQQLGAKGADRFESLEFFE